LASGSGNCRKYDILLHFNEVVCGLGRSRTWFGYQHFGIRPDFVTMAKDDPADPISYFRDLSTFDGSTAGPMAALENMRIIKDEGLLENASRMGELAFPIYNP
jgi:taurine-pyruvate aminotransferase